MHVHDDNAQATDEDAINQIVRAIEYPELGILQAQEDELTANSTRVPPSILIC